MQSQGTRREDRKKKERRKKDIDQLEVEVYTSGYTHTFWSFVHTRKGRCGGKRDAQGGVLLSSRPSVIRVP